jgi:phosphatidylglycerol lysyltransferase
MSDTTKILFFSYLTMWLGLITIMSFIFMIYPFSFKKIISYNLSSIWFSILFIVVVILYFFLCIVYTKPIKVFKKYDMKLPNIKIAVLQILVSVFDWLIASLALYIALPIKSYSIFLRAFLLSHLIGIMSQVPGGIGIFETTMSILLSINIRLNNNFMAGLIIYRLLFYLLPLLLAIILFIISEIFLRKKI